MGKSSAAAVDGRLSGLSDSQLLDVAVGAVRHLGQATLGATIDDEQLRERVRRLQRLESAVHAEKLRTIAEVEERKAYAAAGERSAADWVSSALGLTPGEGRAQAKTAAALRRLPQTAAKLAGGAITPGHAGAAASGLGELERHAQARRRDAGDDMAAWERAVEQEDDTAAQFDAMVAASAADSDRNALRARIDRWTGERDPDVLAERERRALARRGHWWDERPDDDGLYGYRGKATAAAKAHINAAINPLARKTGGDDTRTPAQRRADALATLCRQGCDRGDLPTVAGQRPHVSMVTNPAAQSGEAGAEPAYVDGVGHVSADTARMLACDSEITDITIDDHGRVWDVGQATGNPSAKQRKAVLARDKHCVGCGAPAARCHIHHIVYRCKYGDTVVDNLVLVCWACHQGIHHLGWTVTRNGPTFTIGKPTALPERHL